MMEHPYSESLAAAALRCGQRTAVIDEDGSTSYAALDRRAGALASRLVSAGLRPGDRVAIVQKNGHRYMEAVCGVARAGGVYVPMLGLLPDADHDFIVADSGASFVVCLDPDSAPCCGRFLERPAVRGVLSVAPSAGGSPENVVDYEEAVSGHARAQRDPSGASRSEERAGGAAQILYTSGTTGRPKGVVHSRAAVAAAMSGWSRWTSMRDGDVMLGQFSFSHFGGRLMDAGWLHAATMVVSGTKPGEILDAIERHRVNVMLMVPTLMQSLVDYPGVEEHDLGSLRTIVYAAAPASASLVERTMRVFPGAGLVTGFGQTEAYGLNTVMDADEHRRWLRESPSRLASVGRPEPGSAEVRLVDDDGRTVEEPDREGEICVRAPWVMSGYWGREEESSKVLSGGWLRTRDIARMDGDGYLYICDRKHDMVISGGRNVFPREVEEVLQGHQAVAECCVIGRPDRHWGEALVAVVVLRPNETASSEELIRFCRARLPGFKTPKQIDFAAELPRSPVGKILRREVRKSYWREERSSVHGAE